MDEQRLAALKLGSQSGAQYVTIRTSDLAWLIGLVEGTLPPADEPKDDEEQSA